MILLAAASLVAPLAAQEDLGPDAPLFTVEVDLVVLNIAVTDRRGTLHQRSQAE